VDAVLTTLIGALPQLGAGGGVIVFFWLLIRWTGQDRTDYRAQLAEQSTRHAEELRRINGDHDAELAELRTEIKNLRERIDELNRLLDQERAQRRAAEDQMRHPYPPDQYRGGPR
jgi:TolA-binding protein